LVQKLRETQSSKYTVRDTPLIIGTFKSIQEVLEALG
jgi:chlorite dismutase